MENQSRRICSLRITAEVWIRKKIFEKLEVGKTADFRKHLNQYDVIHIDIQWCIEPAGGADQVITFINKNVIEELRETYEKELSEGTSSLPDALSQISAKTGKKFILILDEWDVLIRDEAANQKIQDELYNPEFTLTFWKKS